MLNQENSVDVQRISMSPLCKIVRFKNIFFKTAGVVGTVVI